MAEEIFYPVTCTITPPAYEVSFWDFPGLTAVAERHSIALNKAKDALQRLVDDMTQRGVPLPQPTEIWTRPDRDKLTGNHQYFSTLIGVKIPGPATRVNITLDESALEQIDAAAERRGLSRSAFLLMAAKKEMYAPQNRRNAFSVMFNCNKSETTSAIYAMTLKLGYAMAIREGAMLLVTDKSHPEVVQTLTACAEIGDTLVVQGWEAFTWYAPSQKAAFFSMLQDQLENPNPPSV